MTNENTHLLGARQQYRHGNNLAFEEENKVKHHSHDRQTDKKHTIRSYVWTVLHYRHSMLHRRCIDKASCYTELFILNLILLNVAVTVWTSVSLGDPDTDYSLKSDVNYMTFLVFSTVVFTFEYILRIWSCVEDSRFQHPFSGRLKWAMRPLSIIDLIAIIPFYLELSISTNHLAYRGVLSIRALRLLRLLSFLRLERSYNAIKKFRKIFERKGEEMLIVSYLTTVFVLISSITMFFLEYPAQPEVFKDIGVAAWWSIQTITSLGYGDIVPITAPGRIFASVVALWGIILFAVPGAILGSGFIEVMLDHQKERELEERKQLLNTITSERSIQFKSLWNEKIPINHVERDQSTFLVPDDKIPPPPLRSDPSNFEDESFDYTNFSRKFNQLMDNQRLLELQLQCQAEQLDTIIYLLRLRSSPSTE